MSDQVLVLYGAIGEVSRIRVATGERLQRNARVVIRSPRGLEVGTLLEPIEGDNGTNDDSTGTEEPAILRAASAQDEQDLLDRQTENRREFDEWQARIDDWKLDLQLIDLEWTLDGSKLVLYVLNDRGPACTTLALKAAAAGLGLIDVQPVDHEGQVRVQPTGGGCGSGGGGCCH